MNDLDHRDRIEKIASLNDAFRASMTGGRVIITAGVAALDEDARISVLREVRNFKAFTPDNDPYGEHDFGSVSVSGHKFFFKIDYFDPSLTRHSDDAADPAVTVRLLTIMLVEEY
jgi:hypothetical protein